ncbi:MAG: DUF4178 domain-containing protein [Pseudomonadota bacterium]
MASDSPQRAYRAACPGCGAPVEFRSAQSTHAVCAYCQSTVVRNGDALSRIGKMADVFDDFSPLQLQASGSWKKGAESRSFTIVGRLQYKYSQGTWTEWYAVFDDGSAGYLSEDNGSYVFSLPASAQRGVPPAASFRVGATTAISGKSFSIASNETVSLMSAQGELPHLPPIGVPFAMVELRSADGEVLSLDYGSVTDAGGGPTLARGTAVLLDDLKLTGLRSGSAREEQGKQFDCPNCGAPVEVTLSSSKSITCRSCNSIIDVSQGLGAALKHAIQDEPVAPLIALGSTGVLQGVQWQVVGFQHRLGHEPDDPDEQFGWTEYLLYNNKRGFNFLVDAEDGWSVVKPLTGAPVYKSGGQSASYLNTSYTLLSSYSAETDYVAGEFYWQVKRGQKTFNRDFANGSALLSQEDAGKEVTWSGGNKLDGEIVAKAFKLDANKALFKRADAKPLSSASGMGCVTIIVIALVIIVLLVLLSRCSSCDPKVENCSSSRTSGGSYGGFSGSSGGHK